MKISFLNYGRVNKDVDARYEVRKYKNEIQVAIVYDYSKKDGTKDSAGLAWFTVEQFKEMVQEANSLLKTKKEEPEATKEEEVKVYSGLEEAIADSKQQVTKKAVKKSLK